MLFLPSAITLFTISVTKHYTPYQVKSLPPPALNSAQFLHILLDFQNYLYRTYYSTVYFLIYAVIYSDVPVPEHCCCCDNFPAGVFLLTSIICHWSYLGCITLI